MVDVSRWLAEHGLGHHAEAFAKNGIAGDVLRELTDADLKELGLNLGDRKRLLKAIAALAAGSSDARAETAGSTARPAVPREAERRQLTVLFCDLVGSTELAGRLDPEDLREVMSAYHRCTAGVVERFEGYVARYLGDGVLAYFGWPRAHEDDAERAIRAGLELTGTVGRLQAGTGLRLAARIGIATGLAVVGDLIGEGAAREETVIGEMPNLAARLQTLAEPGEVVISQATRRLIGGLFELDDLGPQRLKGFAEPLAAWRVAGERHAEGRFEARQVAGLTPLVGREEELALLLRGWQRTKKGEGQVVLLSGEPGIGKSRLVRELHERLADGAHQRLLYQCSPYHQTSALHPVIEQLKRAAGLNRQDPGEARLNKLEALLARGTNRLTEAVPLVATLLSLATGHRYPPLDLSLQRQKERTLEVLVEHLEGLASEQPVLVVYEDVHWIDPTTLELLDLAIERLQRTRVLLLITFRPEFQPSWSRHPRVTTLSLARLGRRDGALMVDRVVGAKVLPPDVTVQIVAKADGVPLFVEELTKTVLESGLIEDAGDHYELAGPLPPLAIPATLHESLLARLDRLAPVREVAQIGAALGREFSYELLAAVAPLDEPRLSDSLDQLVSSELVFRHGTPPEATYSFKHALVQDAAYGTLLKSRRQQLHARIAKVLEGQFPETARTQPELLAHHSMQAGLMEEAVEYWTKAGQLSLARSAMLEAVAQLMRGLEVLRSLPEGPERNRRELDLQVALGRALTATKGWAAPEVGSAYARGRELCLQEADAPQFTQVLSGLFAYNLHCGRAKVAHEIAEDMLRLAERQQDPAAQVAGHRALGGSSMWRGKLIPALAHFEQALALYDQADHDASMLLGMSDARVLCLGLTACVLTWQGHPDQALLPSRQSCAAAHQLSHAFTRAHALHMSCWFHQVRGDRRVVLERAAAMMALTAEHGFASWHAVATIFHGWALVDGDEIESGITEMRRGLAALQATGMELQVPHCLGLLASACTRANDPAVLDLLAEALERVDRTEERWFEAELYRLKGEALLALSPERSAEAEVDYRQALVVARSQGARLWELRAATSLARLWRDQGRLAEAHDLLAPVYGWFTEGFDTPDLEDARPLLDALA